MPSSTGVFTTTADIESYGTIGGASVSTTGTIAAGTSISATTSISAGTNITATGTVTANG